MSDRALAGRAGITRWMPPDVDRPMQSVGVRDLPAETVVRPPTAAEIEQWQAEARQVGRQQGYDEGLAAGRAAGEQEVRRQAETLQRVVTGLATPLHDFEADAERELAELALIIARQIIRRELRTDPGEVIGLVREAMALLPSAARDVKIHLHPDDKPLVRDNLNLGDGDSRIELLDDPTISRGGCRIDAEPTRIDATLESRLNQLSAAILGGERENDE